MLAERVLWWNSINVLQACRSDNSQLDKTTALWLNSFKTFSFDLVKSNACKTIALFNQPTNKLKEKFFYKYLESSIPLKRLPYTKRDDLLETKREKKCNTSTSPKRQQYFGLPKCVHFYRKVKIARLRA